MSGAAEDDQWQQLVAQTETIQPTPATVAAPAAPAAAATTTAAMATTAGITGALSSYAAGAVQWCTAKVLRYTFQALLAALAALVAMVVIQPAFALREDVDKHIMHFYWSRILVTSAIIGIIVFSLPYLVALTQHCGYLTTK